jgi:hypothetical protein
LVMGRHVVGQCDGGQELWRIRRPFRLFVDEDALPCPRTGEIPRADEAQVRTQFD